MSILVIIIVGAIVGWIATRMLGRHEGFFMSIAIGIIGSFIGSFISEITTGSNRAYLSFSPSGLIWSIVGAIVFVGILNSFSRYHTHHTL